MFKINFEAAVPQLTVKSQDYYGINILEKLERMITMKTHQPLRDEYKEVKIDELLNAFEQACSFRLQTKVPVIGFVVKHPEAEIPTKTIDNVGYDVTIIDTFKKLSNIRTIYETHISIIIPLGYYVELVARSSICKTGYMLSNSVGIIDPGYIGTVKVPLIKIDPEAPDLQLPVTIAQLILKPYVVSTQYQTIDIIETTRGEGGFGSTD